jgi:hypothetical protein
MEGEKSGKDADFRRLGEWWGDEMEENRGKSRDYHHF